MGECCDDLMVEQVQKCSSDVGQALNVDLWMGQKEMLWMPSGFFKDKEDVQC